MEVLKDLRSYDEVIPYEPYPIPGGILPFDRTDNGDVLFWIAQDTKLLVSCNQPGPFAGMGEV